jgi:hypothetical protein
MLPNKGGMNDLLFPMTAKIYYSQERQTDYGNVIKQWVYDRDVKCSMISEMSTRGFSGELKTKGTDFIYDSNVFFRTPDDIRKDKDGNYHPITAIAITEAKDPEGTKVWVNGLQNPLNGEVISTKYEIKTIVPTFDYSHNLRHWRVFLSRSQNQKWDNI